MGAHTPALQPAHIDSDDDDGDDGSYTNCDYVTHTVQFLGRVGDGVPRPEAHGRTCLISVTAAKHQTRLTERRAASNVARTLYTQLDFAPAAAAAAACQLTLSAQKVVPCVRRLPACITAHSLQPIAKLRVYCGGGGDVEQLWLVINTTLMRDRQTDRRLA